MLAWLLRYGPKSMFELLAMPVSFNNELMQWLGQLMQREKDAWEEGLQTGDS